MRLRLLGTGAADGIPTPFGEDRVSRHARKVRGKDIRTRSGAIVDDTIKIDLSSDTYTQLNREGLSGSDWTALFFTHSDDDHVAVAEIQYALDPFTSNRFLPYTIFANSVVARIIRERYPKWPIEVVITESFKCYEHLDYRITPIKATHISDEDCHNLLIQKQGKTLLYATDTGIWGEPTWKFLQAFKLDALVIECTDGFDPTPYEGHLSLHECVEVVQRLRSLDIVDPETRVITTHHSVRGLATHHELEEALKPHGIEPGYDGMAIDV
jgi:phosphoribosyl 1,2-cyclic phosphate phosphodiesterase